MAEEFPLSYHDFYKTNGGGAYATFTEGPSLTRQEFAEECDINTIMARYETTGQLPINNGAEPRYVDFTAFPDDLMGTMSQLSQATDAFMTLPAKVRREFDNDPHMFVDFASDPSNIDQLREWGLAKPLPEPDFKPIAAAPTAAPGAPIGASAPPPASAGGGSPGPS